MKVRKGYRRVFIGASNPATNQFCSDAITLRFSAIAPVSIHTANFIQQDVRRSRVARVMYGRRSREYRTIN
jgi:hypothetical protein